MDWIQTLAIVCGNFIGNHSFRNDALRSASKGIRKNIEKWVPGVFMPD